MCFTIPELLYQSYFKTHPLIIKTHIFLINSFLHKTYYPSLFAIKLIHPHFLYIIQSTNY